MARAFKSGITTDTLQVTGGTPGTGKVLQSDVSGNATWQTPSGGTGDVTAAASFATDNTIIRADGTGKGVQTSPVVISDSVSRIQPAGTDDISIWGTGTDQGVFLGTGTTAGSGNVSAKFYKSGSATTSTIFNVLSMNSQRITTMADPSSAQDAATKNYVDTKSISGDVTGTVAASVVGKINGISMAGLATGILKNTTATGVPSIATAGTDYSVPSGVETVSGAKTFNNGKLILAGSTSGTTTVTATAVAGSGTVIVPTTGTLATQAGTEALTNKDVSSSTNIFPTGSMVQLVSTNYSAVGTGSTAIPFDDTIPQITEGVEFMTQAITPKSTTNILLIEAIATVSMATTTPSITMALFQDSTANALAATDSLAAPIATGMVNMKLNHKMTAGTTSATTLRIRMGGDSGTITFNGQSGVRRYGGITLSNITITEIKG